MKSAILLISILLTSAILQAQSVSALPPGRYEARLRTAPNKWDKGDILLLDDTHYKLSTGTDTGEYRFSVAAQRIFFTSGPLKAAFTKVGISNNKPVIILPAEENGSLGIKAEVWASKE